MDTSNVIYTGDLRTEAIHLKSGSTIISDAPTDNHGKGEAFSPTDLTATSLGSCILTTMGIYAQQHDIDMRGSTTAITKIMSTEGPRRIAGINVVLHVKTAGPLSDKHRQALENTAHTCPVARSLHPDVKQHIIISFEVIS